MHKHNLIVICLSGEQWEKSERIRLRIDREKYKDFLRNLVQGLNPCKAENSRDKRLRMKASKILKNSENAVCFAV